MDICFVVFWVKCSVCRLKNYAPKTSGQLEKSNTYYESFVSIFFKMPVRVNHNRNPQTNASKTGQADNIFLPNFQNILVRPIGVYWSKKNGRRVHLQLGAQQLEQSQAYGPFQNRNFRTSNGTLPANFFPKIFTQILLMPLRLDKHHKNTISLKLFFCSFISSPPNPKSTDYHYPDVTQH